MTIRNLVFEGGGIRGIAYTGALRVLDELGVLQNVERVAGSSAGAITAALLAVGYSPRGLRKAMIATDFTKFKDLGFPGTNIYRFLFHYGIYRGDTFYKWFSDLLAWKGYKDARFMDLDGAVMDLVITGTNVSKGRLEFFSRETTPDMKIADAVRISMSIPIIFRPVKLNGDYYADGGVIRNYPIHVFDEGDGDVNHETLGFRLDDFGELLSGEEEEPEEIRGVVGFASSVISTMYNTLQHIHLDQEDWMRTIPINSLGISATDFSIQEWKQQLLIAEGEKAVRAWADIQAAANA